MMAKASSSNVNNNDERQFILDIIRIYRDLPILWKVNSPDYSNRIKKADAYNILIEKFNERYPGANRETVVKKINCLRTNYRKVKKKVGLSRITDNEQTEVRLWYYDELSFLDDQQDNVPETAPVTKTDVELPIVVKYELPDSVFEADDTIYNGFQAEPHTSKSPTTLLIKRQHSVSPETNCVTCFETGCLTHDSECSHSSVDDSPPNNYPKSAKLPAYPENGIRPYLTSSSIYSPNALHDRCESNIAKPLVSTTYENMVAESNEFDYLAKIWASDLQQMDPLQRLFARKAISDVLFEGLLGNLDRDSVKLTRKK